MDSEPLVSDETRAGEELIRRLDRTFPVKAAFWLKEGDEDLWYLYITSDQINDQTLDCAYGDVLRLSHEMATPWLDPFRVKLVPTSNRFAQSAIDILHRYPLKTAARLGGTSFGEMGVSGVFLYPADVANAVP